MPAVGLVTLTLTVQVAFAASVDPLRLTDALPTAAVAVPPQVLTKPFGEAIFNPSGKLSVSAMPVSATVFPAGFVKVRVSTDLSPAAIVAGAKAFATTGGATTVRVAVAVLPVPPLVEVTAPVVFT